MKEFIRKYHLEMSAFMLGASLSGLTLSFYYSVNNDKKWSDYSLISASVCLVPSIVLAKLGRKWK